MRTRAILTSSSEPARFEAGFEFDEAPISAGAILRGRWIIPPAGSECENLLGESCLAGEPITLDIDCEGGKKYSDVACRVIDMVDSTQHPDIAQMGTMTLEILGDD